MLEPLFYEALANDRSADNDYYSRFKCKIPFLNGGLFEPINDYDWTGTDIIIPDNLFSNNTRTQIGDIGTGILDVFDRYNFTVKEDEPLEKEVAVDPEMLGKVFENLLEVKERKDKGAFYTPREIVHYMCQQSLINYLETNTDNVLREDIERFIQYGDIALDLTVRSLAQKETYHGKSFVDEKLLIPKSISDNYQKIDQLLQDIKIVDPAVGSGAFPVGMMNEIVKARSILTLFFNPEEQKDRTEYYMKRQCIENCLYGVDIDPSAVEIAKLRFWLSLIVDEEKKENIQPLPNLDHKIMCGNSLLEEFEGIKLFDERLLGEVKSKNPTEVEIDSINDQILRLNNELKDIKFGDQRPEIRQKVEELETLQKRKSTLEKKLEKEKKLKEKDAQVTIDQALEHRIKESQIKLTKLRKLQIEFFNEQNRNKKKKLREEIDKIEWELIEATLEEQGHEEALAKLDQYRKTNVKPFFLWKLYFAEIFQRENPGFDVVIANPPYINTNEMKEMNELYRSLYQTAYGAYDIYVIFFEKGMDLLRRSGSSCLITSNKYVIADYGIKLRKLFLSNFRLLSITDLADCRRVFQGALVSPAITFNKKENFDKKRDNIKISILRDDDVKLLPNIKFDKKKVDKLVSGKNCVFDIHINEESSRILNKLQSKSNLLSEIANVRTGVMGFNYWPLSKYIFDEKDDNYIRIATNGFIDQYIFTWGKKARLYKEDVYHPYLDINNCNLTDNTKELFRTKKIIIRGVAKRLSANMDIEGIGLLVGVHSAVLHNEKEYDYRFLLGVINSTLLNWFHLVKFYAARIPEGSLKYPISFLNDLPIVAADVNQQKTIVDLVSQILTLTNCSDYLHNSEKNAKVEKLKENINQSVFQLYDITPVEREYITAFKKGRTKKKDLSGKMSRSLNPETLANVHQRPSQTLGGPNP